VTVITFRYVADSVFKIFPVISYESLYFHLSTSSFMYMAMLSVKIIIFKRSLFVFISDCHILTFVFFCTFR